MIAFEVFVNGERHCIAGIEETGVLSAIVTLTTLGREDNPATDESYFFRVGGLDSVTKEHLEWNVPPI